MAVRTGIGYDSHRLVAGRRLVIGGVELASELGLAGHSDADVLTHAVIDAVLGAAGLGDIGMHFPDTDERWRDADSIELLRSAAGLVRDAGYAVTAVDTTLVLETPQSARSARARSNSKPMWAGTCASLESATGAPARVAPARNAGAG